MVNLLFSVNIVLPMFLIMYLGIFLRKINMFNEDFLKIANKFTFNVLFPALLFYNLYSNKIYDYFNLKLALFAVLITLFLVFFLFIIVLKLEKDNFNRGVMIQGSFRSNFILFGIPVCANIFGDSSTGVLAVLITIIVPLYNFLSVIILDIFSNEDIKIKKTMINILKNPLIIGSVIGIITSLLNVKIPNVIEKAIYDLAKMSTPLALIVLGGQFKLSKTHENINKIFIVCLGKLVIVPLIVVPLAVIFGFRGVELGAIFSMSASPVAVSSFIMSQQYNSNYELAGQIVFISTIFSSLTIFIFVYILKSIGLF